MLSPSKLNIPVLMYHSISADERAVAHLPLALRIYTVHKASFWRQIEYLFSNGFKTHIIDKRFQFHRIIGSGEKNAIITFDDGFASCYDVALDFLCKYGFHANFFITVNLIGKSGYLDWSQVKELAQAGHLIGSHGLSHRYFSTMNDNELCNELSTSKDIIEAKTGVTVTALSLPGRKGFARAIRCAKATGYSAVCTSYIGASAFSEDMMILSRIPVKRRTSLRTFASLASFSPWSIGYAKAWSLSKSFMTGLLGLRLYETLRGKLLAMAPRN